MDWIQVSIFTTSDGIEPVSGRLYRAGVTGIEIEDEKDFKDFLENNKQYWDYVDDELIKEKEGETKVKIYVSNNTAGHEILSEVRSAMLELKAMDKTGEFGRLDIELENMNEEDWANNWKKYFHPIPIGERIMIKPEWEELKEETDRLIFTINPGMSFGTGTHETTQLCLEALEKHIVPGCSMLDLGCGSGILSIISLMLGADEAYAVDIDPNAVDISRQNAELNNIDKEKYHVMAGDINRDKNVIDFISKREYDVVAANIVADVIIFLAPAAKRYMKPGGVFIVSGIIADREDEVKDTLIQNGFEIEAIHRRKDWRSMICR